MKYSAGFIGAGNMGGALIAAAVSVCDKNKIAIADKNTEAAKRYDCILCDNKEVANKSKFIFLGVKPQILPLVLDEISASLSDRNDEFVLVTMAAGISMKAVSEVYPVIRIMPNMPAKIGKGMILYSVNSKVTEQTEKDFLALMKEAGEFEKLDEQFIDAGSAVSGCGPAFAYMFIDALCAGGEACGLKREQALKFAAQTVLGAAEMVKAGGKTPSEMRDDVCSPGGTTIEGVKSLQKDNLEKIVVDAVKASYRRTLELKK